MKAKQSKLFSYEFIDKRKTVEEKMPMKVFEARESILTVLFQDKHFWAVHNICYATFLMFAVTEFTNDIIYKQKISLGTNLIIRGFANFHIFWFIWICMFLTSLLPFLGVKFWLIVHNWMNHNLGKHGKLWNRFCLIMFVTYIFCLFYYYTKAAISWDLGYALKAAVLMENLRCIIKVYAFVKSKASQFLNCNSKKENLKFNLSFKHYLYFLFAPVLVYQDTYPRSKNPIRWNMVGYYLLNMVLGIFLYSFLLEKTFISDLKNDGLASYTWKDIAFIIFKNTPHGLLMVFVLFYIGMHSWFNAFAEMLQFSDRLFYKDWWTSEDDDTFLRTWNVVVHDWLYVYMYKDLFENLLPGKKSLSKTIVLIISGIGHDYVLNFTFGFSVPMFVIQCGIVIALRKLKINNATIANICLILKLSLQTSFVVTIYTMEYFAMQTPIF